MRQSITSQLTISLLKCHPRDQFIEQNAYFNGNFALQEAEVLPGFQRFSHREAFVQTAIDLGLCGVKPPQVDGQMLFTRGNRAKTPPRSRNLCSVSQICL